MEGKRGERWAYPVREVSVGAGIGAESKDIPVNALGVPIKNMERLEDISLGRRDSLFQLEVERRAVWSSQILARSGREQEFRLLSRAPTWGGTAELEAGYRRDHSELKYIDSRNTPLDTSDDALGGARRRFDADFIGLRYERSHWKALAETDGEQKDILAGYRKTGESRARQIEGVIAYSPSKDLGITGFVFSRESDFTPMQSTVSGTNSRGFRGGFMATQEYLDLWKGTISLAQENIRRDSIGVGSNSFHRDEFEARLGWAPPRSFPLEGELEAMGAFVQDSASAGKKVYRVWQAGADLTSPKKYYFGFGGRGKKYSRIPRASEIFGDGALLLGNADLPVEEGWRAGLGPWAQIPDWAIFQVEGFAEEASNAAVPWGVSALNARVIPIGGTWVRGWKASAKLQHWNWQVDSEYSHQDARNASNMNWQFGRPLPGRPRNHILNKIAYTLGKWQSGLRHEYAAGETRDIAGFNTIPVRNRFGTFFGYSEKSWRVLAEGKNLFARANTDLSFQGAAGANILEPVIEESEYVLTLEVKL